MSFPALGRYDVKQRQPRATSGGGWIDLFDGQSLNGVGPH
jgi:hypothetical protein